MENNAERTITISQNSWLHWTIANFAALIVAILAVQPMAVNLAYADPPLAAGRGGGCGVRIGAWIGAMVVTASTGDRRRLVDRRQCHTLITMALVLSKAIGISHAPYLSYEYAQEHHATSLAEAAQWRLLIQVRQDSSRVDGHAAFAQQHHGRRVCAAMV